MVPRRRRRVGIYFKTECLKLLLLVSSPHTQPERRTVPNLKVGFELKQQVGTSPAQNHVIVQESTAAKAPSVIHSLHVCMY